MKTCALLIPLACYNSVKLAARHRTKIPFSPFPSKPFSLKDVAPPVFFYIKHNPLPRDGACK